MAERPILFGAPMVRAILAGKKTQTRRVVKFPRFAVAECVEPLDGYPGEWTWFHEGERMASIECPYGEPGDTLLVREQFAMPRRVTNGGRESQLVPDHDVGGVHYLADGEAPAGYRSRPSIHMPRWASRLTLLVKSVRVERLQEISKEDVIAEGVNVAIAAERTGIPWSSIPTLHDAWRLCWDSINGARAPWASNPWVWVVEFERALDGAKERERG